MLLVSLKSNGTTSNRKFPLINRIGFKIRFQEFWATLDRCELWTKNQNIPTLSDDGNKIYHFHLSSPYLMQLQKKKNQIKNRWKGATSHKSLKIFRWLPLCRFSGMFYAILIQFWGTRFVLFAFNHIKNRLGRRKQWSSTSPQPSTFRHKSA